MRFAVIAAGEGSRLAKENIPVPKPLVKVCGETLIDRLVRIFSDNDAEEIVVITRKEIEIHSPGNVPIRQIVQETPSSMRSFHEISRYLADAPFVLTTVDTIFREDEFRKYISFFRTSLQDGDDGLMGVTDFVDDEKPLFIKGKEYIDEFLDEDLSGECSFISGGIYGLTPRSIITLDRCIGEGKSRMRNFQRALIADGEKLRMFRFSKILDIDHAADIEKAERFIRGRVLGIYRGRCFSPNCVDNDRVMIDSAMKRLSDRGYEVSSMEEEDIIKSSFIPDAELYLSMARTPSVLKLLHGRSTINNPGGVAICDDRRKLAALMREIGVPMPMHIESPTERDIEQGVWLKKASGTTTRPSDTAFCSTYEEYLKAVSDMQKHGVTDYVIERHEHGDLVKFYGITPSSSFHVMYPTDAAKTKFGLEVYNDKPQFYDFDRDDLRTKACCLADVLGIKVFGGDAIIHKDGTYTIIDFNDWPSFSSFAEQAAETLSSTITL